MSSNVGKVICWQSQDDALRGTSFDSSSLRGRQQIRKGLQVAFQCKEINFPTLCPDGN